jgi:hypothetical protein
MNEYDHGQGVGENEATEGSGVMFHMALRDPERWLNQSPSFQQGYNDRWRAVNELPAEWEPKPRRSKP